MKRFKWIVIVLVVVAVLLGAFIFMWNIQPRNRLANYVAQMEAEGAVLEVADLRSTRPEGTTFYSGPIEESATAFLLSPEAAGPDSGVKATDWPWYGISKKAHNVCGFTPEEQAEAIAAVEENRNLIAKLKEIGNLAPTRMEDIIELTGLDREIAKMKRPDLLACFGFRGLLSLDAYVAHEDGRPDDALESCAYVLRLAGHVRDVPGISRMGTAMIGSLMDGNFLSRIVQDAEFSDEAVATFAVLLDESVRREALAQKFEMDLLLGRQTFRGGLFWPNSRILRFLVVLRSGWNRPHDQLTSLRVPYECAVAAKLPYFETRDALARIERLIEEMGRTTPISVLLLAPLLPDHDFAAQGECEVRLSQAKIALALNQHKRDNEGYPDDLNALVPAYLPEVPVDVFSGNEMLYFTTNGSYVLYCAGHDGKDHLAHYRTGDIGDQEPSADEVRLPLDDGLIWGRWRAFPRASQ